MNTHFAVKLSLQTPLINATTPLDAIVARLLSDELDGDWQRAHNELPFATENSVLCCSAPIFEAYNDPLFKPKKDDLHAKPKLGVFHGPLQGFAAKLDPSDINTELVKPNAEKGTAWRYGTSRVRECGNVLGFYQTMLVQNVWYFGITNDADKLERLVYQIENIGKKRGVGFGALHKDQTQCYIDMGKTNGIVGPGGNPLRPIPVSAGIKVKEGAIIGDYAWRPAYWNIENRSACYIPDEQYITKTFDQIEEGLL